MTDETRKDQEHKDELADKDLDTASGGLSVHTGHEDRAEDRRAEDRRAEGRPAEGRPDTLIRKG
jgi:hypothetical protein